MTARTPRAAAGTAYRPQGRQACPAVARQAGTGAGPDGIRSRTRPLSALLDDADRPDSRAAAPGGRPTCLHL